MQLPLIFLSLFIPPGFSSFNFNDKGAVRDIAADFVQEFGCGCVNILKPNNMTAVERLFVEQLTYSIARMPLQVMSYTVDDYVKYYYTDKSRETAGSCIKWLNIVMVAHSTRDQLQQVPKVFINNSETSFCFLEELSYFIEKSTLVVSIVL